MNSSALHTTTIMNLSIYITHFCLRVKKCAHLSNIEHFHMEFRVIGCQVFVFHQTEIQLHYNSRTPTHRMQMDPSCRCKCVCVHACKRCDEIHFKWDCKSSTLIKWSGASWITTTGRRKTKEKHILPSLHFTVNPFACKENAISHRSHGTLLILLLLLL